MILSIVDTLIDGMSLILTVTGFIALVISYFVFLRKRIRDFSVTGKVKRINRDQLQKYFREITQLNLILINPSESTLIKLQNTLSAGERKLSDFNKVSLFVGSRFLQKIEKIQNIYKFDTIYNVDNDFLHEFVILSKKDKYTLLLFDEVNGDVLYVLKIDAGFLPVSIKDQFHYTKIDPGVPVGIARLFHNIFSTNNSCLDKLGPLLSFRDNNSLPLQDTFLKQFQEEILKSRILKKFVTTDLTFDPKHTLSRLKYLKSNKDFLNNNGNKLTRIFIICSQANFKHYNPSYNEYSEYMKDIYMITKLQYYMGIQVYISKSYIGTNTDYEYDVIDYELSDGRVLSLVQERIPKSSYAMAEATLYNYNFKFNIIDYHLKNSIKADAIHFQENMSKTFNGKTYEEHYQEFIKSKDIKVLL